jgi:OPA family glycerol-3-phosphate transporter-like MFS transporter
MRSLRLEQTLIVTVLFGGYAALYFCRADLSAAGPLLEDYLGTQGIGHDAAVRHIGTIASSGVLAYAIGKLFLCGLGDLWGGRTSFLIGLGGATLFTAMFATSHALPLFMIAWIGNRLTQSIAWAGLIKVSSRWFNFSSYGLVIGILSLSYLVGDAAARPFMGMLIQHGYGWASCFWLASAVAAFWWLANTLLLRESRAERGHPEATTNPRNLFAGESAPRNLMALLKPLLLSRSFLLVCALSLGCTIIRETFNFWTPIYLRDSLRYSNSDAAWFSGVFPAVGAVSVLLSGWLSDRLGINGRPLILFLGLAATAGALLVLMTLRVGVTGPWLPLGVIGLIGFCLLGPYSYLGGAFALDFGGKSASALASGLIDGVGYLGGALAGYLVAWLSVRFGWQGVFVVLATVSALAAIGAALLYRTTARLRAAHLAAAGAA